MTPDLLSESLEPRVLMAAGSDIGPMPQSSGPSGTRDRPSVVQDLNGDHVNDVVVATDERLTFLRNLGGGTFAPPRSIGLPLDTTRFSAQCSEVFSNDYDNDGDNDVLVIASVRLRDRNRFFPREWLYLNDGAGNLTLAHVGRGEGPLNQGFRPVHQLDLDGDRTFEFIDSANLVWSFANGSWTDKGTIANLPQGKSVYADIDGDGDIDGFSVQETANGDLASSFTRVQLHRNNGAAGFSVETIATINAHLMDAVLWKDVNADGAKDLVVYTSLDTYNKPYRPAVSVFVLLNVSGTYQLQPDPIYSESTESLRARGGHTGIVPLSNPQYTAGVSAIRVGMSFAGDARPDIAFRVGSVSTWSGPSFPPSNADLFSEAYTFVAVAEDPMASPASWSSQPQDLSASSLAPVLTDLPSISSRGDLDGDGIEDVVLSRGLEATRILGSALYVQLSTVGAPLAFGAEQVSSGQSSSTPIQLGERVTLRATVQSSQTSRSISRVAVFIDRNQNARPDSSDFQTRNATYSSLDENGREVWTIDLLHRPAWGNASRTWAWFVPIDTLGVAGTPIGVLLTLT